MSGYLLNGISSDVEYEDGLGISKGVKVVGEWPFESGAVFRKFFRSEGRLLFH